MCFYIFISFWINTFFGSKMSLEVGRGYEIYLQVSNTWNKFNWIQQSPKCMFKKSSIINHSRMSVFILQKCPQIRVNICLYRPTFLEDSKIFSCHLFALFAQNFVTLESSAWRFSIAKIWSCLYPKKVYIGNSENSIY